MKLHEGSTLREAAFAVCTALDRASVTAVLSGGSAASIHAPDAITSYDLDFILVVHARGAPSARALEALGYTRKGQDYIHEACRYQLEFPPGPLAIGDELIHQWDTLCEGETLLHILSPTDSCRDRLAAFYHFYDRNALRQALALVVAQAGRIDFEAIRSWSEREGASERFEEFRSLSGRSV